jgi:Zn-dependent protease
VFERALTVGRVQGIPIRIHASWLVIAALITWSFWNRFTILREYEAGPAVVMAGVTAVGFFVSILIHELAHALEAKHRGVEVGGITLFLFGGVTESRFDVQRPRDEFALTAIGPYSSFVLAAALGLTATAADDAGWSAAGDVAGTLGWLNLALGAFNLLPGAPLDGGRILRSAVWWVTGDRRRSIRAAAVAGQVLGALILGLGLLQLLFVPGAFVGGVWFAFIGWFLMRAAAAELMQSELHRALDDVPLRVLVADGSDGVGPDETLEDVVDRLLLRTDDHLPVADERGVVGVVGIDQVRRVDRHRWPDVTVRDVMVGVEDLDWIDLRKDTSTALDRLFGGDEVVVARDQDRVVGLVTPHRVMSVLDRAQQLRAGNGRAVRR